MIEIRLHPGPFERIKSGQKKVEFRLYDEKRRLIKNGDVIEFSKRPEETEKVRAKIVGLFLYDNVVGIRSNLIL